MKSSGAHEEQKQRPCDKAGWLAYWAAIVERSNTTRLVVRLIVEHKPIRRVRARRDRGLSRPAMSPD